MSTDAGDLVLWLMMSVGDPESGPLSESELVDLAAALRVEHLPSGTTVVRRGQPADVVWIVREGTVDLTRQFDDRRSSLEILRTGDVFGDESALLGLAQNYDALTVTECTLLGIEGRVLRRLLERHHALAIRWLTSTSARLRQAHDRLGESLGGSLSERLATVLLREAGSSSVVTLSQALLAELLGVRRSSINRILRDLERSALVRVAYRRIEVVDVPGLQALAAGRHPGGGG